MCQKTCLSVFPYIFQAKYVRNKKINENKLVGGTTTWGTTWGHVYEHLCFLRAKVIPVNPQIHGNVMCPLFVLNFIFEPLFVHAPDIIVFLKFHLGTYTR